jgi:hypothetical protein
VPTIEVDFECYCAACGTGICNDVSVRRRKLTITPCKHCLDAAEERGYDSGYDSRDTEVTNLESDISTLEERLGVQKKEEE